VTLPVAILAGGLASRMRPLTERLPKVLLEVAGQPFAVHQIKLLERSGVTNIVFCVGYLGEQVQEALGDGRRWGLTINYSFDGDQLLGTGGALRKALPLLGDAFFVLYGDAYLQCPYIEIEKSFQQSGKLGLMTVFRNGGQWDRSNVIFQNGHIARYDKHNPTPEMHYIDYGLGILRAQPFDHYPLDRNLDLATVYEDLLTRDQLAGYEVTQRFYEIGSPAGLKETNEYLSHLIK
jgi:NDP-sugar pyrophosphorylase family protein